MTTIDPVTNIEPVNSRVSALLENTMLPVPLVAEKLPVTVNEPDTRTLPVISNKLPE